MLRNTFCHIPGIGLQTEGRLWSSGLFTWEEFLRQESSRKVVGRARFGSVRRYLEQSLYQLQQSRCDYFAERLPAAQQWRLFSEFQSSTAYLDIETTGMGGRNDHITTIALYDGESVYHYVCGRNLEDFKERIGAYKLLVTYNGKCFDLPFIRNTLRIPMDHAHIDLRYVLGSLGYRGGLKSCERQLGIERFELEGVDGFFAVLLWRDYLYNGNPKALDTLLAYNIEDVVNLETLMVLAYNAKLQETPFSESLLLHVPGPPANPFRADLATLERIRREYGYASDNTGLMRFYGV